MYFFFEMVDKIYFVFFDVFYFVSEDLFKIKDGMEDWYYVMEVGSKIELDQFKVWFDEVGVVNFGIIDYYFCYLFYFFDFNGLVLEFIYWDVNYDGIFD